MTERPPFKRNPISCERICSLSRLVSNSPSLAWGNSANSLLERTLDDSANKRIFIPEAFLALDECLLLSIKVVSGLEVNLTAIEKNLQAYAAFSATEPVLLELVKKGFDRQETHELLRVKSMQAWKEVQKGEKNPLKSLLLEDARISKAIAKERMTELFDVKNHVGNASEMSASIAEKIGKKIGGVKLGKTEEAKF